MSEKAGGCNGCNQTDGGKPCSGYTYPIQKPQHLKRFCDDSMNQLVYDKYAPDSPPNPRIASAMELGTGCRNDNCGTTRYERGCLVVRHPVTYTDPLTGVEKTCKVIRKAGPLADEEVPLELTSGPLGPAPKLMLSGHTWADFIKTCAGPNCYPGPLLKLCDVCICFAFTWGNIMADGETELSDIKYNSNEHCDLYAGLWYDATCSEANCNGQCRPGCLVIDPNTLSDVYDPAVHHVKIDGTLMDAGAYARPVCNGADLNPRVRATFMPGNFS